MRKGDPCNIGPRGKVEFHIDPKQFVQRLQERWPNATVQLDEYPNNPSWLKGIIPLGEERVKYTFPHSHGVLLLDDGDCTGYAEVALWFRSLVPAEYRLFLSDENGYFDVEIQENSAEDELLAAMSAWPC